jgi:hypothetical protein
LDSVGVGEQLQLDFHDNGSIILEESRAINWSYSNWHSR